MPQTRSTRADRNALAKEGGRAASTAKGDATAVNALVKVVDAHAARLVRDWERDCSAALAAVRERDSPRNEWLEPDAPGFNQSLFDYTEKDSRTIWRLAS